MVNDNYFKMFATLVLLVLSGAVVFGEHENVAYFDNFECKNNPDYCGKTTCILTPHNDKQDEQKATMTCELKKPIDDLKLRVTVFAKELQSNLADIVEDFCAYMTGKSESKVLAIVMPFIKNYSNVNHPCPYSGSVDINELPMGSHLLASHDIPSGDYVLTTSVTSNGVYVTNTTFLLHIPEGKSVVAAGK